MIRQRGSFLADSHQESRSGRLIPVGLALNYIELGGVEYNCAFVHDLTERNHARNALQDANDDLRRANGVKTYFAATMSHELRNTFGSIVGYHDVLMNAAAPEPSEAADNPAADNAETVEVDRQTMQQSRQAAAEGLDIITVTLEMSRGELSGSERDIETVSIPNLFTSILAGLPPMSSGPDVEISESVGVGADWVHTDPVKLKMIMVNLLTNARKFTREGSICLSAEREDEETLVLRVRDTGVGIPESQLPTLFEPFEQAHGSESRKAGGAGPGLYLVRRLVEMLGGSVAVTSEMDKGSELTIRLPRGHVPDEAEAGGFRPDDSPAVPPTSLQVLVAEDSPVNRLIALRLLRKLGYDADIAEDGESALRAALAGHYDVLLLDLNMPKLHGLGVAKGIREEMPAAQCPSVIALTASTLDQDRADCLAAGIGEFLTKPLDIRDLSDALQRIATARNAA